MKIIFPLFIACFISNIAAFACRCQDPGTIKEAYQYTSVILQGKVLTKTFISLEETMQNDKVKNIRKELIHKPKVLKHLKDPFITKIELQISAVYKGKIQNDTITIFTTRTSASCGFTDFEVGQPYIIFASPKSYAYNLFRAKHNNLELENTYWTSHCTLTNRYNKIAAEQLKTLSLKKE